jgi:hypothetical protein
LRGGVRSRELLTVTWGLTVLGVGSWSSAERRRARRILTCLMCSTDSRRKRATMRGCRCRCELCRSYPYSDTIDIHISLFDLDSGIRVRMRASRKGRRGCESTKTTKPGTLRRRQRMMEACMCFGSKRSRSENNMMFWYVVHPFRSLSDVFPLLMFVPLDLWRLQGYIRRLSIGVRVPANAAWLWDWHQGVGDDELRRR